MKKATSRPYIFFTKEKASELLPPVAPSDHKASRGRCLLLAGSKEYAGAGILAARGALRAGSGYVTLAQKNIDVSSLENPDFLVADLNEKKWSELKFDALLLGPGFGVNPYTAAIIRELKETLQTHVVLDADALTVCAEENLLPLPKTWIATPHTGELSRLLKMSPDEINRDRVTVAWKAQRLLGCVLLLKGHGTLIADGENLFKIATGNAALAKAGTGDVLSGIITAFRAQKLDATSAAVLGAYVHGATANLWAARKKDLLSMTASDVIESLPRILYLLRLKPEKST